MTNSDLLRQGIDLAKSGEVQQASVVLAEVVRGDPLSEEGWLWLGRCRSVTKERIYCFNKVLSINPDNKDALHELAKLGSSDPLPFIPTAAQSQLTSIHTNPPSAPTSNTDPIPPKKNWVRRTIYLLIGIMVGIYLGRYIANSLAESAFFDNIDNAIALRTINVPEFNPIQETPSLEINPTPTISLSESYEKRLETAWPLITQASSLLNAQNYASAIPLWNQALEIVPDYVDGYYQRGKSYFYLTKSQRAKSEYDYYLQLAIDDFDNAVNLDANVGDYYLMRANAYSELAYQQSTRIDFQKLEQIAVENYIHSWDFPLKESWVNVGTGHLKMMIGAGDCEKAIQEINGLIDTQTDPAPGLHSLLSDAYYCAGDLEKALEEFDYAVKLSSSECLCKRATILYGLGRFDEAMDAIENSLSTQPYYGGARYYFRALIYAERGNIEQAQKDLDFGLTQTWARGGMLSYVQGKIALAQNKKEDALFYFQEAEATYFDEGPMLEQIRKDLLDLGGMPRDVQSPSFDVTPMPFFATATPVSTTAPELTITP